MQDPWHEMTVDHALPPPKLIGLVERLNQIIMCMISKQGEDKKADWPSHLAEIVHASNATHSAVTGCSPHYLMFRQRPRLPVNIVFPTIGSHETPMREASAKHVDKYIASIWDRLRTALQGCTSPINGRGMPTKWYYERKIGAVKPETSDGTHMYGGGKDFNAHSCWADSKPQDECNHSLNWVMVCKAKQGGMKWVSIPCVKRNDNACLPL